MQAAESDKENVDVEAQPTAAVDDSMEADAAPEKEARASTPLKRKKAADGTKVCSLSCARYGCLN